MIREDAISIFDSWKHSYLRDSSVPILGYHRIGESSRGDPLGPFTVSPVDFARQMSFLSKAGYQSLSLYEYIAMDAKAKISSRRRFVITFDDGYRDYYLTALPILRKFGFGATVFLVSDWFLHGNDFRESPNPMLRKEDIAEMKQWETHFGAHSCSHPSLPSLSAREAWQEISASKEILEEHLRRPIDFFSYPYGQSDERLQSLTKTSGFKGACGNDRRGGGDFNLPRTMVRSNDTYFVFRLKAKGWSDRLINTIKRLEKQRSLTIPDN